MIKKVNVGIVGFGYIGKHHCLAIKKLKIYTTPLRYTKKIFQTLIQKY